MYDNLFESASNTCLQAKASPLNQIQVKFSLVRKTAKIQVSNQSQILHYTPFPLNQKKIFFCNKKLFPPLSLVADVICKQPLIGKCKLFRSLYVLQFCTIFFCQDGDTTYIKIANKLPDDSELPGAQSEIILKLLRIIS